MKGDSVPDVFMAI